jgi:hypothetical protein
MKLGSTSPPGGNQLPCTPVLGTGSLVHCLRDDILRGTPVDNDSPPCVGGNTAALETKCYTSEVDIMSAARWRLLLPHPWE